MVVTMREAEHIMPTIIAATMDILLMAITITWITVAYWTTLMQAETMIYIIVQEFIRIQDIWTILVIVERREQPLHQ